MIDNIKLANYKSFFADQVKEAIDEQQKINRSQMRNLFKTGELSLAYVDSIQQDLAFCRIIEAAQKLNKCRFSGTVLPDNR